MWKIAAPSIFSRLAMFSMTLLTQAFAGHLGDLDLAAISIATTVIISISFGFLVTYFFFFSPYFPFLHLLHRQANAALSPFFLSSIIDLSLSRFGIVGLARYGECVRDAMRPSLWGETVPYVGYIHAEILDCSVSLFDFVTTHVRVRCSHIEAHRTVHGGGGADWIGGDMVDTTSL